MAIPFVRQFPNGRRALSEFRAPPDVEMLAGKFIALGGAYVCEILPDEKARIAACLPGKLPGEDQRDVEEETVENGPPLAAAVERLVRASVKHVEMHG